MSWMQYQPGVSAIQGADPSGPVIQPPIELPPTVDTNKPQSPVDWGARVAARARREREFLTVNPNRRAGPMGRNPDGSINWDLSTGIGQDGMRRSRNAPAPGYIPTGPDPKPTPPDPPAGKSFNAAIPRGR